MMSISLAGAGVDLAVKLILKSVATQGREVPDIAFRRCALPWLSQW
jgi:hypothetical protein